MTTVTSREDVPPGPKLIDRLDPELRDPLLRLPPTDLRDIPAARRAYAQKLTMSGQSNAPGPDPAVMHSDHLVPGEAGDPAVLVRAFRPCQAETPLPCLYWIQGGGFVLTSPDLDDRFCEGIVIRHGCIVVSVDWRRAPEHPFPAAARDCYSGLAWTLHNAEQLSVDPDRLVIGGHSSGGGSAAGLALMVRDRGELRIAHQMLLYPMLDDTNCAPSGRGPIDERFWSWTKNEIGWRAYLGDTFGTDVVSPYAAPSRMANLSGLASATILVGELDLFADEDIEYARRLIQAGVPTELHVYPAAHHGFDRFMPTARVSRRLISDLDEALARALRPPLPSYRVE